MSCCSHWQSSTSDLRPETFFTWRALTSSTVNPRDSRSSNNGIQYTPVDSMATVSTPQALSQSASALRSIVKLGNSRTGASSRSGGTATKWDPLPISIPAALGWVIVSAARDLPGLRLILALRRTISASSFSWNVVPHRVRLLAQSLKQDISPAAANHHADSPMSMTSPRTTLKRGQNAPLSDRSSAAPRSTLPQRSHPVFLRRDLRQGADYHAHTPLDKARPLP